jgi:hypothetical protein
MDKEHYGVSRKVMMTSTHGFVGALLGVVTGAAIPELAPAVVLVGFVGGMLPDLDLVATHRRSLHFPAYASGLAMLVSGGAVLVGTPTMTLLAVFSLSVAVHCLMDAFCGGVEVRPWEATSDHGVYNHVTGRWIEPRRWIRYAGAPEDFALALVCAVPAIALTSGRVQLGLVVVLVVSGLFTAVRRQLPTLMEQLFDDVAEQ